MNTLGSVLIDEILHVLDFFFPFIGEPYNRRKLTGHFMIRAKFQEFFCSFCIFFWIFFSNISQCIDINAFQTAKYTIDTTF